ncbi:alpha/beta hydrolase [Microbacterium schleiferi]|uniref:Alpha/beta hydrolase n=1 Tax=Microbacterium schleiferi TaxID=69362 RepID=A0A7S8MYI5_9MICO|nr:alpha/beta fold hydrolase [Microbacterium schleiferi]QPE05525.1 alpha/beta hydrolase [Microbacterium schleiferi]
MQDASVVVVPGLGGSSPGHWQSIWEAQHPSWVRSAPASWDEPDFEAWDRAVGAAVQAAGEPVVLVAHSLGCLTALAFAAHSPERVRGVFLVAPPDPDAPSFPTEVLSFGAATATLDPPPIPTVAVTSPTDPYCPADRSPDICKRWGARQIDIGDAGHINVLSGHGPWPEGLDLLRSFIGDLEGGR